MAELTEHFLTKVFASSGITKDELIQILPKYKQVTFDKNKYLLKDG